MDLRTLSKAPRSAISSPLSDYLPSTKIQDTAG